MKCTHAIDFYLVIMNSHMPLSVSFLCGDCKIAIVIRAMYEYGGFTSGVRPDFSSPLLVVVSLPSAADDSFCGGGVGGGDGDICGRKSSGDGDDTATLAFALALETTLLLKWPAFKVVGCWCCICCWCSWLCRCADK